jgi:HSP20 family molecular chaperone IbpA
MNTEEIATKGKQESKTQEGTRPGRWYVPDVDILEDDDQLWLWADVPGVSQDQIEVGIHDDVLTIEGHVSAKDYEGLSPAYTEYNVGNWVRRFTIPAAEFDPQHVSAKLTHGVLEVRLPKAERAKPRRIPVAVG